MKASKSQPDLTVGPWEGPSSGTLDELMTRFEAEVISCAMLWAEGNRRKAARALDIGYSTLKVKLASAPGEWRTKMEKHKAQIARGRERRMMDRTPPPRPSRRRASLELTPQERFVAQHRLLAKTPLTYRELAQKLGSGLTGERLRQIGLSAERKLGAKVAARGLPPRS